MRNITSTNKFDKHYIVMIKRGKNPEKLIKIIKLLVDMEKLPSRLKDHSLSGNYKGFRELHIEPDWLLIYRIDGDNIILEKTGTHSDLFG